MSGLVLLGAAVGVAGLMVEQRFFASHSSSSNRAAVLWSVGWIVVATVAAIAIATAGGPVGAWSTVYVIERSLSLDNVFLFSLLLGYFAVPRELRGWVILIGIAGAFVIRGVAIVIGIQLVETAAAVLYVFGVLLIVVAVRAAFHKPQTRNPDSTPATRLLRRVLPLTSDFRGRRLLVREDGRLHGTPLLLTIVAIIATDIAFAVDSIPAALAVSTDPTVIWTANVFAMLGLGALLALVEILVGRFRYLDKTIALVLAFVGAKILLAGLVHISDLATLAVIATLLTGGAIASSIADRVDPPADAEVAARRPPRCPPTLSAREGH